MGKGNGLGTALARRPVRRPQGFLRLDCAGRCPGILAAITAILIGGVGLGYLTYRIARSNEQVRVQLQFREVALREAASLERDVIALREVLYSLRAAHASSDGASSDRMDAGAFREFVEPSMERHPAIRAMSWVPAIPDTRRQVHEQGVRRDGVPDYCIDADPNTGFFVDGRRIFFPALFVHPRRAGDLPAGCDLASDSVFLPAIRRAAATRQPTLADPAHSLVDGELQSLMLLAVFRDDSPESSEPRLSGFVALLFRPGDMLSGRSLGDDMELELTSTDAAGRVHTFVRSEGFGEDGRSFRVPVQAASQFWRLSALPTPAYIEQWSTPNPILFGIVATALGLGLAGVLFLAVRIGRERELRRRDRTVRSVLASLEEGVIVADRDGQLVFANGAAGRILGVRPDRARAGRCAVTWGCHLDDLLTPCPEDQLPIERALSGATIPPMQLFVSNPGLSDGRWVSMSASPLRDEHDTLSGAVAVLRDVTALRRSNARRIEMQLASAVQRKLYPRVAPQFEGYDLAGAVFSAEATCGDYFDFIPISKNTVCIAIGDVSGHGIGPALVMTQVRSYLRAFAQAMSDPADIVDRMNRMLAADLHPGYFVTLLVAFLDLEQHTLRYVNAGPVPGQILDAQGQVRSLLERTGLPLGLLADRGYYKREVHLDPGETVVFMTDGLIESRNVEGEFLGDERAIRIVADHIRESASDIVETMYESVRSRSAWRPLSDDLALVVVKSLSESTAGSAPPVVQRERVPASEGTITRRAK